MFDTRDRQILRIALPSIVSNVTVPLLGLVDVAITGHLGAAAYIGAIAVGSSIFNSVYWLFAFLRMGTSGMTSQAYGRRDFHECMCMLTRSLLVASYISLFVLVFQLFIREAAFGLISPSDEVRSLSEIYFDICVWGAPATLLLNAFTGWFLGMQNSRTPMLVAVFQNIINIAVSILLVFVFGMKVEGVAIGTLVAQYTGLAVAIFVWFRYYGRLRRRVSYTFTEVILQRPAEVWAGSAISSFFNVNRDIFLRTLCLVAVHFYFIKAGASQGDTALAVNTLLMQFFTLFSYVMDGFSFAGEALVGKSIGAINLEGYLSFVRRLFLWGAVVCALFTLLYVLCGGWFVALLTDNSLVVDLSADYIVWAYFLPVCGVAAFVWDGVFIGATATRYMLLSMFFAVVIFFILEALLVPIVGNHGLWVAFLCYLFARGLFQTLFGSKVRMNVFGR